MEHQAARTARNLSTSSCGRRISKMRQLLVNKADLREVRIVETPDDPLPGGQARFHIDLFALTTNNISYAAMGGPPLNYWEFFPADDAWGKPPCWAFGTITQSNVVGVEVGARYYGYFPAADTWDVVRGDIRADAFSDTIAYRAGKAAGTMRTGTSSPMQYMTQHSRQSRRF